MIVLTGGPEEDEAGRTLDADQAIRLVANRYRRYLLYYLLVECEESVASYDDVFDYVTERTEADTRISRKRLEIECHHVHLPRLEEAGLVEYDPRGKNIRCYGDGRVEGLLRLLGDWCGTDSS